MDEIEPSAAFLASDAAHPITGQVVYIDGGYNVID
ncbi:SDR family oxidoreductase [Azospirillum brasilense]